MTSFTDDPGLEARLTAIEERLDEVCRRQFSDLAPLRPPPASSVQVDPDVAAIASSGKEKDLAKAILEHIKRTGADLPVAEQAVRAAAGLTPG